jgi:subtilisin family serine protease
MRSLSLVAIFIACLFLAAGSHAAGSSVPERAGAPDLAIWRQALLQPHAAGEILVAFDPLRTRGQAATRLTLLATAMRLETIPDLNIERYRLRGAGADEMAAALAELNAAPGVAFAEPNYLLTPDFDPNDPFYVSYAGNPDTPNGGYLALMRLPETWDIARGHPDVVVAIIDTGIDLDHEDLAGALWQNPGEIAANGLDDDGNGFIDDFYGWDFAAETANVNDWYGHGSHVAGIVGARFNNGIGIAGMAPKTRLMPIGVFAPPGYGTYADEIEAIAYATDEGAKVINLSLGGTAYSRGEQVAIEYATRHGVVVVAAAGNDGREVNHWPAAHEAAIAVASTTANDTRSSFSNQGDFVDVAAPGSSIISVRMNGGYVNMSGTSMATPHTAGLAALILGRNPSLSPVEVRSVIENTAVDLGAPGRDKTFGHGRIDAFAAIQATAPYTGPLPPATPDWLRAQIWPPLCNEVIAEGGFESPVQAAWAFTGTAAITGTVAMTGSHSLYLTGLPEQSGSASQSFTLPPDLHAATIFFGIRIENDDRNLGNDPTWPGRDRLSVWLRTADGAPLLELMRAGNADYNLASGLPWDRYLHVLAADELAALRQAVAATGGLELWFQAENAADPLPTRFFIDNVRLCASRAPLYLPWLRT